MKTMRMGRFLILLPAFWAFLASGCSTVIYRPTQADKMTFPEAARKILSQKGNKLMVRPNYRTIADVKLSSASIDFTYYKRAAFGSDSALTDQLSVRMAELGELSVLERANTYAVMSGDRALLLTYSPEGAFAAADALLVLKNRAAGVRPAKDQAAEAAFQEEARRYRELAVKPALPEEARKHAVQGDFAIEMKKAAAAAQSYQSALALAPWWPEGHFKRAVILAGLERYEDAVDEMKRYQLLEPDGKQAREAQDNIYKWEGAGALAASVSPSGGAPAAAQPAAGPDGDLTFTGRVESTKGWIAPTLGGGRGSRRRMTVLLDNGERLDCFILSKAPIQAADGTEVSASNLPGKRIEARYINDHVKGWFRVEQAVKSVTAVKVLE